MGSAGGRPESRRPTRPTRPAPASDAANGVAHHSVYYNQRHHEDAAAARWIRGCARVDAREEPCPQTGEGHNVVATLGKPGQLETLLPRNR